MNTNTEANVTVEILFRAEKDHVNPFLDLTLDVVFTIPGVRRKILSTIRSMSLYIAD